MRDTWFEFDAFSELKEDIIEFIGTNKNESGSMPIDSVLAAFIALNAFIVNVLVLVKLEHPLNEGLMFILAFLLHFNFLLYFLRVHSLDMVFHCVDYLFLFFVSELPLKFRGFMVLV